MRYHSVTVEHRSDWPDEALVGMNIKNKHVEVQRLQSTTNGPKCLIVVLSYKSIVGINNQSLTHDLLYHTEMESVFMRPH